MDNIEAEEPEAYIAPKKLCVNKTWTAIVPEDHPDVAYLLAMKGSEVPLDLAQRLGLLERDPVTLENEYRIQEINKRRSEKAFKRLSWEIGEHARMLRETDREFPIRASANIFVGVMVDWVARNCDRELPKDRGTLSVLLRRNQIVSVSGSRIIQIEFEAYKLVTTTDGIPSLYRIRQAIRVEVLPTRNDECRIRTVCESGEIEAYYYGEFLPFIGKVYPESGLTEDQGPFIEDGGVSGQIPASREGHQIDRAQPIRGKRDIPTEWARIQIHVHKNHDRKAVFYGWQARMGGDRIANMADPSDNFRHLMNLEPVMSELEVGDGYDK